MRIHRLIAILLTLEAKGTVKAKTLAASLETSTRTIYRDVDTLCEAGIPLVTTTGPNGGISISEGYRTDLKNISPEDLVHLHFRSLGIRLGHPSDNVQRKLDKLMSRQGSQALNTVKKQFYLDEEGWWTDVKPEFDPNAFVDAVRRHAKLTFEYLKMDQTHSMRTVHPYGVVIAQNDWYLVAYCEKANAIRTFKCERMSNIQTLESTFEPQEAFDLEHYWKKSKEAFKTLCQETD